MLLAVVEDFSSSCDGEVRQLPVVWRDQCHREWANQLLDSDCDWGAARVHLDGEAERFVLVTMATQLTRGESACVRELYIGVRVQLCIIIRVGYVGLACRTWHGDAAAAVPVGCEDVCQSYTGKSENSVILQQIESVSFSVGYRKKCWCTAVYRGI